MQTCTENFHRLKDYTQFGKMDPRDRMVLVEHHELCMGCLKTDHGWTAKLGPYKEERIDACKKPACKASHHRLQHIDGSQEHQGRGGHRSRKRHKRGNLPRSDSFCNWGDSQK